MMKGQLNWTKLGKALRVSAKDAHDRNLPDVRIAYSFMLDNPECFIDQDVWPDDMPQGAEHRANRRVLPGTSS